MFVLGEQFFQAWLFDFVLVAVAGCNTSITAGDDAVHELAMIAHTSRSDAYIYLVFLACGDVYTRKDSKRREVVLCKQPSLITCC